MSVAPIRQLKNRVSHFDPFEQDFAYTGSVQTLTIPATGLYQLDVWGAAGGTYGGNGGHSCGYKALTQGTVIYIVVGGKGDGGDGTRYGGYNGGGKGYAQDIQTGGGGGATHMATVTGTLDAIGYTDFVTNGKGLIVAGGGGGGGTHWAAGSIGGGAGGGTTGGDGGNGYGPGHGGAGGTQSAGASFGKGGDSTVTGEGGSTFRQGAGGGGGGFYGGYGGYSNGYGSEGGNKGGGGGSGWTGGVPQITYHGRTYSPSMTNGQQSGNGKAKITRIA